MQWSINTSNLYFSTATRLICLIKLVNFTLNLHTAAFILSISFIKSLCAPPDPGSTEVLFLLKGSSSSLQSPNAGIVGLLRSAFVTDDLIDATSK